jgi:hypothetical protein
LGRSFLTSKSGFAKILAVLIAIIIVASIFGVGYFATRQTPVLPDSPTTSPTFSPSATSTSTPIPTTPVITLIPTPSTSTTTPTPAPTTVMTSLSDALASGYVQATFAGTGYSSGDCINLKIKRLVTYTVEIDPPGLGTLLTTSENAQNMVILRLEGIDHGATYTPTSRILLTDSNEITYIFTAYCMTFHKSNPEDSTLFSLSGTANSDVLKILNSLSSLSSTATTTAAVQTAIWTVTDNVSLSDLSSTFPDGVSQIGNAKTILTTAGVDTSNKQLFT